VGGFVEFREMTGTGRGGSKSTLNFSFLVSIDFTDIANFAHRVDALPHVQRR
jgi:hypothetical protein